MVVCDEDHTSLSRKLFRRIEASASLRIQSQAADVAQASRLVRAGKAYALVRIPAGTEGETARGRTAPVLCFYNAQYNIPGSLISRDLDAVVAAVSQEIDAGRRQAQGEPRSAALAHAEPLVIEQHALFNPQLNYVYYLLLALLPTMLQIFILVTAVQALGSELKEGTARQWRAAAGASPWRAVLGKLLPHTLAHLLLAGFMIVLLFRWLAGPLQGSRGTIALATVLFVLAYEAIGLLLTAWFANLRLATSAAAFYSAPAFAFTGVTFPLLAMPLLGQFWGGILPLTYYLRLLAGRLGGRLQAAFPDVWSSGLRGPAAAALPAPDGAGSWGRALLGAPVRGLWQVIKGEWQTLFADPGVLLILLGTVVLYSFFYPLPYLPEVVREVPVAVVDQDRSALSRRLVRMSDAHPALRIALQAQSVAEAEAALRAAGSAG